MAEFTAIIGECSEFLYRYKKYKNNTRVFLLQNIFMFFVFRLQQ